MKENMKLTDLIRYLDVCELLGSGDTEIAGLEYDSRRVASGMMFAAISGYKTDGNEFIPEAVAKGAAALLCDRRPEVDLPAVVVPDVRRALADLAAAFYDFPGRKMDIFGVTGTNGKSSAVFMIKAILEKNGTKSGMINSLVYDTGKAQYKAERTTPDSVEMQKYLAEILASGRTAAVVETSSHALVLHRVDNIDFKYGLFTGFSRDHLDFHKTMEQYLAAKKLLLDKLSGPKRRAVINADTPEFAAFVADAPGPVMTFSAAGNKADVGIEKARLDQGGTSFELVTPTGRTKVTYHLPGRYNLTNAAGAAAVGVAAGIADDTIAAALETMAPIPGRFQPLRGGQPFAIIIDYAHTPDALERLCRSAREITSGRVLILFGCGGDRDRGKRPLMAAAASGCADLAVLTSDNPRTEDPQRILDDARAGMVGDNYRVIPDRREAIRELIGAARAGDTVLLAGKGAEEYQEIGTVRYPFSDSDETRKVLAESGYVEETAR